MEFLTSAWFKGALQCTHAPKQVVNGWFNIINMLVDSFLFLNDQLAVNNVGNGIPKAFLLNPFIGNLYVCQASR